MKQWIAVLIAVMASFPFSAALAEEGEKIKPIIPILGGPKYNMLTPIKDLLSGRPWLILSGIDPAMSKGRGFNAIEQANPYANSPRMQAGGAGLVPFRDPAPAFSRGVLITRDFGASPFQTEPHMAVNPTDPDHIVVGVIDYGFDSLVSYITYDGGSTWEGPYQAPYPSQDLASAGDPVLAFDRKGRVYMAGISLGIEEFNLGPLATESLVSSISIARSDDGGENWIQSVSSSRSKVSTQGLQQDRFGRTRGTVSVGFLDKPWLGIGPDPANKDNDIIYVVYTDFEEQAELYYLGEVPVLVGRDLLTTIRMVSSRDQGKTWSDPVSVSPTVRRAASEGGNDPDDPDRKFLDNQQPGNAPTAEGKKRVVQGPQVNIAKDGTVYFSWMDSLDDDNTKGLGEIQVATSTDGGKTIKRLGAAATFNEIPYKPRTNPFRFWASSFPQMALSPNGEIYIVYSGRPPDKAMDDADVYMVSSMDKGVSWSRPVRLNGDEGTALQFLPAIDVDPKGKLHAMWLDTRDDKTRLRYHVYYTTSEDQGKTWGFEIKQIGQRVRDARVSDFPTNPNRAFPGGAFIGDYVAIKSTEEDVYLIWPDGRLAEFGGFNQKIGFARQRPINSPAISVTPPAGAGGQSVVIQGFSFQPESEILVQLGDAIISSTRSNGEGRFTLNLYMPLTAEGPQTVRVFDASGNGASASYFTEFGFNNLQASGKDIKGLQDSFTALQTSYKELLELIKNNNNTQNNTQATGVKELQTSVSALQTSQKDLLSAVTLSTNNAQAASSAVKELQTSLAALQASQKALLDTVNNGVTNNAQAANSNAQAANTNAQAANNNAQAANNSIKELQAAITALQASQKSLLEAVTNGLTSNTQSAQAAITNAQAANTNAQAASTNAQAANSGIKELQNALTSLQASQKSLMDSLNTSNAQTAKDLKDLQTSVSGLQLSNQGLQTSNQGLQNANKDLQVSLSALQNSYKDLLNTFSQLQGNYKTLQDNYKGLQAAYQDMMKRLDEVNKKLPVPQPKK